MSAKTAKRKNKQKRLEQHAPKKSNNTKQKVTIAIIAVCLLFLSIFIVINIVGTLNSNNDVSTLLYFYRDDCEECKLVNLDTVPDSVEIDGKTYPVNIIKYDAAIQENEDLILKYLYEYNVPPDDQRVPIVFFADTHLAGAENINNLINDYIEDGKGLGMPKERTE